MSSRGLRNNNPGNIRQDKDKWLGEIKPSQDPDFKQFTSMAYGYRAMFKLLNNYQKLHGCRSLSDFINRWAPPSENNTTNYISYVTRWSGVSDIETVDTQNHDKMAKIRASYGVTGDIVTVGIPEGDKGATGDKGDKGDTGPAGTYTAGANITIDGNVISATDTKYTLPIATSSVLGGVKIGSNITVSSGTISLSKSNVTSALGYTPANTSDIPEIPIALPNPYALTINGTSYTGLSAVSINTARILTVATLDSSTVSAGYSYNNISSRTISSLSGFSSSNPDSVIISTAKLIFTASNVIKIDGLDDLSGTYYIYCLSFMANDKVTVNGAVYA